MVFRIFKIFVISKILLELKNNHQGNQLIRNLTAFHKEKNFRIYILLYFENSLTNGFSTDDCEIGK